MVRAKPCQSQTAAAQGVRKLQAHASESAADFGFMSARFHILASALVVMRDMQTTIATAIKSSATATLPSPPPSPTQQPGTPAPAAAPPAPPTQPPDGDPELSKLIDDLVKEIRKCAANALFWRMQIGVQLHQWRDGLGAEDWLSLLRSRRLPFSVRTAQTLARIGGHTALANSKNAFKLPDAVTVLNQLAGIPPTDLEQLIARNEVSAAVTLPQARKLSAPYRAKKTTTSEQPAPPLSI